MITYTTLSQTPTALSAGAGGPSAGAGGPQPLADDLPGQGQHGGVVVQDEVGVGGQDDAVQLGRQPAGILAARQLARRRGESRETPQQHPELSRMLADRLGDRCGTDPQLQGPAAHETSAGERPALE